MIKTMLGMVEVRGDKAMILADLSCICSDLFNDEGFTKEEVLEAAEIGCQSEEEVFKNMPPEVKEMVENLAKALGDHVRMIVEGRNEDGKEVS